MKYIKQSVCVLLIVASQYISTSVVFRDWSWNGFKPVLWIDVAIVLALIGWHKLLWK